jgi:hypothetical protein
MSKVCETGQNNSKVNLLQLFVRQSEFLLSEILGGVNNRLEVLCQRGDDMLQNENSSMARCTGSIPASGDKGSSSFLVFLA